MPTIEIQKNTDNCDWSHLPKHSQRKFQTGSTVSTAIAQVVAFESSAAHAQRTCFV